MFMHVMDGVHDRGAFRGFGLVVMACIFDLQLDSNVRQTAA
jgi:hypothetical protein